MATRPTKPVVGEVWRAHPGNQAETRQSMQTLNVGASGGGGSGAQGPPGVSVGDPNSIKVATAQVTVKDDQFYANAVLFEVPQGWAFEVLNCRVECYAGYSGNGGTTDLSRRWRVSVDPEWSETLPAVVSWGEIGTTPCPAPGIGGGIVDFYHFQHPGSPGEISVLSTGFSVPGEASSRKCYPFRPFLANPSLSRAVPVNLYTKYLPATYETSGQIYPASNFIVRVEYWVKELTKHVDSGEDREERPWFLWDPPFTSDGSCPSFPS